jgi:hypothetical protein
VIHGLACSDDADMMIFDLMEGIVQPLIFEELSAPCRRQAGRIEVEQGEVPPNGAKTQLLMYTNTNYLPDLYILLGLFNRGYQLMA